MVVRPSLLTDRQLLNQAQRIVFAPFRDRVVLYNGAEGQRRAELFVRQHPGYTRIDELLQRTAEGKEILSLLGAKPWDEKEEIWWDLSRKLARAASGDIHCFGPERLTRNQPVSTHQSRFRPRKYADTIFEKVELPELDNNQSVETIYYNGKPLR
jgi:hypothetical protein